MIAPRHWAEDRPQTWEEWSPGCERCNRTPGCACVDCGITLTGFEMTERRMLDDSLVEIAFSDEPVIPMYEIVCTGCANV